MLPPEFPRCLDVPLLVLFRSAPDQMHLPANLAKIDPVSGAKVDSQFRNALTDRLNVAKVAIFNPVNATENDSLGLCVKPSQPLAEWLPALFVLTN